MKSILFILIALALFLIPLISAELPQVVIPLPTTTGTTTIVVNGTTIIADCPAGYAVQNLTATTIECVLMPTDNSSWSQSLANTLYLNRTSEALYTTTYNSTYASFVSANDSWNESYANGKYVKNNSGIAGYIPQWQNANTINNSAIYQNGSNVGIGTTAPTTVLDVNGRFRGRSWVETDSGIMANAYYSSSYVHRNSGYGWFIAAEGAAAGRVSLAVANTGVADSALEWKEAIGIEGNLSVNTPPIYIKSDGNVGIGTTSPIAKLSVNGNASINETAYLGTSQQSSIKYNNSDLLINPKESGSGKVYVQGDLIVSQNITASYKTSNGSVGVTVSGTTCTITSIKDGIIIGATCV